MAICWERAVPLAFHLCCFYFSVDLVVRVPFHLVFGAGYRIRLYRFLIIAFLSTLPELRIFLLTWCYVSILLQIATGKIGKFLYVFD